MLHLRRKEVPQSVGMKFLTWRAPWQVLSGPLILMKITLKLTIKSQNIWRRVGGWVLINISPSNIFGKKQNIQDVFGRSRHQWVKIHKHSCMSWHTYIQLQITCRHKTCTHWILLLMNAMILWEVEKKSPSISAYIGLILASGLKLTWHRNAEIVLLHVP